MALAALAAAPARDAAVGDNPVAYFKRGHTFAHGVDDAGKLMPHSERIGDRPAFGLMPLVGVDVRAAYARRRNF